MSIYVNRVKYFGGCGGTAWMGKMKKKGEQSGALFGLWLLIIYNFLSHVPTIFKRASFNLFGLKLCSMMCVLEYGRKSKANRLCILFGFLGRKLFQNLLYLIHVFYLLLFIS